MNMSDTHTHTHIHTHTHTHTHTHMPINIFIRQCYTQRVNIVRASPILNPAHVTHALARD